VKIAENGGNNMILGGDGDKKKVGVFAPTF